MRSEGDAVTLKHDLLRGLQSYHQSSLQFIYKLLLPERQNAMSGKILSVLVVAECFTRPPLARLLPLPVKETPNVTHVCPVRSTKWLIHFTTYWSFYSYACCGPTSSCYCRPLTCSVCQLDSMVWYNGGDQCKRMLTSVLLITVILFWFWRKKISTSSAVGL